MKKNDKPLPFNINETNLTAHKLQLQNRISIDQSVSINNKNIILGDPGVGKSAFLKFFTLDILSENPVLNNCVKKWGEYLPIWIPFAFVTKQVGRDTNISIQKIIENWFTSHDEEKYKNLIKTVLDERKILLVIDGLDEWTDEMAALQALRRLEIFIATKELPVIYSSRPYGYKLLENNIQNAFKHSLAFFSIEQQKSFLLILFSNLLNNAELTKERRLREAEKNTNDFIVELHSVNEIAELAQNPLMLSVLVGQKIRNAVLPRNKFQAYSEITQYFIEQHPRRRKTEANITDDVHPELNDYLHKMYSLLAYRIQFESSEGIYDKRLAEITIENFLEQELGFNKEKSKKESRAFIELGENFIGILAEKSPKEIAFIHRQFQEFLCAKYLSELSLDEIENLIDEKCILVNWHQVIYYAFHFISRPNEFIRLLLIIEEKLNSDLAHVKNLKLLYFNIGINIASCPLTKCLEILASALDHFTFNSDIEFKNNLLELILNGIQNPKIKEKILKWIEQWSPYCYSYGDYRIERLNNVTGIDIKPYLKTIFFNGELRDQFKSSNEIGKIIKDDNKLVDQFINLSLKDSDEVIRALAINALIIGVNNEATLKTIVGYYDNYPAGMASILQFFIIKAKVILQINEDTDLQKLLSMQSDIPYELKYEFDNILIKGWCENDILFEECMLYIKKEPTSKFDFTFKDHFWKIFIDCFHKRQETIQIVCDHIRNEKHPFRMGVEKDTWKSISNYFSANPELIPVLHEKYFNNDSPNFFEVIGTYYATSICKTEDAKKYLLVHIEEYHWHSWIVSALIENWKQDEEVVQKLKGYLEDNEKISWVFHVAHLIVKDKKEIRALFLAKLQDETCAFRLNALVGLIELDKEDFEQNFLTEFMDTQLNTFKSNSFYSSYNSVLETIAHIFPKNEKIKSIIKVKIEDNFGFYSHLSMTCLSEDREFMVTLLQKSLPLDDALRFKMIEKFFVYKNDFLEELIKKIVDQDKNENIRTYAAIHYYQEIKKSDLCTNEIIADLEKKASVVIETFDEGLDKQIALVGFLLLNKLAIFKKIVNEEKLRNKHYHIQMDMFSRNVNVQFLRLILKYYSKLKNELAELDVLTILNIDKEKTLWEVAGNFIEKDYESFNALVEYVNKHKLELNKVAILSFMVKHFPASVDTKEIALRMLGGDHNASIIAAEILIELYKKDNEIYNSITQNPIDYMNTGKVIYLCKFYPESIILNDIFNQTEIDSKRYNGQIVNYVRALKVAKERVTIFLDQMFNMLAEFKKERRHLLTPLMNRIEKDEELQNALLRILTAEVANIPKKIFLYKMLSKSKTINISQLNKWRKAEFENETKQDCLNMAYDIIDDVTVCYINILNVG